MSLLAELSQMLIKGFLDVNKLRMVSFIDLLAESATICGKPQTSCPFYARLRIGGVLHRELCAGFAILRRPFAARLP